MGRLVCSTLFINISTNNYRPSFTHTHTHSCIPVSRSLFWCRWAGRKHSAMTTKLIGRLFIWWTVVCVGEYMPSHLAGALCTHRGHAYSLDHSGSNSNSFVIDNIHLVYVKWTNDTSWFLFPVVSSLRLSCSIVRRFYCVAGVAWQMFVSLRHCSEQLSCSVLVHSHW